MEQVVYQLIEREPQITYYPRPVVPLSSQRRLLQASQDLAQTPELFDGAVSMVSAIDLDFPELEAFSAPFSWRLAVNGDPVLRKISSGALSVAVWLEDHSGQLLWQQRSRQVDEGLLWSVSSSGLVAPGLSPRQAIESTVARELGISLPGLTPMALVIFTGFSGVQVLYHAELSGHEVLNPDSDHVADLFWAPADDPPVNLRDSSSALLQVWSER